jgi:hypothetical protein
MKKTTIQVISHYKKVVRLVPKQGVFSLCVSLFNNNTLNMGVKQHLLRSIPTTCHSGSDLCALLVQNNFLKEVYGLYLLGVGLDSRIVMATVCDNASNKTVLVANMNKWLM